MRGVGGVGLLVCSVAAVLLLVVYAAGRAQPVTVHDAYQGADVRFSAENQWVLFPRECTPAQISIRGAASAIFYPDNLPGIVPEYDSAVRFDDASDVSFTQPVCIDYRIAPKLVVHFTDGTQRIYKLGMDVLFISLETWLLIGAAMAFAAGAAWALRVPRTFPAVRLGLWFSAVVLLIYAWAFARMPDFFGIYLLDVPIFALLFFGVLYFSGESLLASVRFDARIAVLVPAIKHRFLVALFWVWVLAFGYSAAFDQRYGLSEMLWLPFFLWAFLVGMGVLWWARPSGEIMTVPQNLRSRQISLIIALVFVMLSLARDGVMHHVYGFSVYPDSTSYLRDGAEMFTPDGEAGIPKRIFPYVFLNFITGSAENPYPLFTLQSVLAAAAVGGLVYVLARKYYWLGIAVGLLCVMNITWGSFNLTILTESAYASSMVIVLAAILWHGQYAGAIPRWQLFLIGLMCGWALLFKGTALFLILPVMGVYYAYTRRWTRVLLVGAGFGVFLLGVMFFNQWRYQEFGLIGPQSNTLGSALFSYHLFAPENGPVAQGIDALLVGCYPDWDYDNAPRFSEVTTYQLYNPCLLQTYTRNELTALTSDALKETVLAHPLKYARILIEELGIGFAASLEDEYMRARFVKVDADALGATCGTEYDWCYRREAIQSPVLDVVVYLTAHATFYFKQLYGIVDVFTSPSNAISLFAFLMMCGFLFVYSRERWMVAGLLGLILYQMASVLVVHIFLIRYGFSLMPLLAILSALALGSLIRWIMRSVRQLRPAMPPLWVIPMVLYALVYYSWGNYALRESIHPAFYAQTGVNLIRKHGFSDIDLEIYNVLHAADARALYVEKFQPSALENLQVARRLNQINYEQQRYRAWYLTGYPGYLRDISVTHILLDDAAWQGMNEAFRETLLDAAHYRLMGEWQDETRHIRLFEVTGSDYQAYAAASSGDIVAFESPTGAYDIYQLDSAGSGVYVVHLAREAIRAETAEFAGELGFIAQTSLLSDGAVFVRILKDGALYGEFRLYPR